MPFSALNCTPELLKASKHVADEYGVGITLHHSSNSKIRQACLQEYGKLPTEHLEEIGVLGPNMLLAHVLGLGEPEIDCLARTQTSVVMCPSTSLKSGAGTRENCRMPEMLEKGINVALGSDSANSSNHLDIIRTMNLAACMYKDARQNTSLIFELLE